ncbi:uncharacterized protein LOC131181971 [Hevea brasiliensis]|uniref:uncharacterized protein LOC131181971 n=1 Tax=Hevea brasiliensis TaxID=3981 RepID=UPI0025D3FBA7|nr:uncharacterized protein LOC131181971 [Hevea brasiliensis]
MGFHNGDLLEFWAPFLLVHLGGPDTITAFFVEDNQLWFRHLLAFITQAVATGYVFIKTLPRNRVVIPTTLLFIVGIIKYLESTSSLYFASKDKFKDSMLINPDPDVNYVKLSEEKRGLDNVKVVEEAYEFFKIFKRLIVDLILSFKERDESQNFFNSISTEDAFKVIAGELNFLYEVLYTKVVIVHSKWGMFFHFISFGSVVLSLTIFHFQVKKYAFDKFGVKLTYSLLFGAIGLDILSFFMAIFSKPDRWWYLGEFTVPRERSPHWALNLFRISPQWALSLFGNFISLKKSKKVDLEPDKHATLTVPFLFRMWYESVGALPITEDLALSIDKGHLPIDEGHLPIVVKRGFGLRWRNDIEFKRKGFLSIDERALALVVEGTLCVEDGMPVDRGALPITEDLALPIDEEHLPIAFTRFRVAQHNHSYLGIDKSFHQCGITNNFCQCIKTRPKKVTRFSCIDKAIQCLNAFKDRLIDLVGLKDFLDEITYVSSKPLTMELWEYIFGELQKRSRLIDDAETVRKICSARGDWVLQNNGLDKQRSDELISYVLAVPYDESIPMWHIATELLINDKKERENKSNEREFSKILSDYMLYLLIMQSTMMATVAGIFEVRFKDTCADAERFFRKRGIRSY